MLSPADGARWLRDPELAKYLGVTKMTLRRWRLQEELNFPAPTIINGRAFTDAEEVLAWMKGRVVQRAG